VAVKRWNPGSVPVSKPVQIRNTGPNVRHMIKKVLKLDSHFYSISFTLSLQGIDYTFVLNCKCVDKFFIYLACKLFRNLVLFLSFVI
jgi:hypothetical protein